MTTENTTSNRGYQLPFGDNDLADDVGRLIAALTAIDIDVAAILVSVGQRALLIHEHVIADTTGLQAALDSKQDESEKGNANGYAALDATGKVPAAQLPSALFGAMSYQGTWNANTNTPTIPAASAVNKGQYYKVDTAGASNVSGITDWKIGDWIVSNGASWDKIDNTDQVASVAGLQGAITATALKTALAIAIADVAGLQAALDAKAALAAANTFSARQLIVGGGSGNNAMNVATASLGEVEVRGNGTGAAMMAFHRAGVFAAYMGIDTDNKWKVGGWSMGAAAYEIVHMGNYTTLLDGRYIENSADSLALAAGFALGSFASDGTKASGTYTPTAAGGNMRYVVNGGAFTLAADPDTTKAYTLIVAIGNSATAGAITFSGFNAVTGDALTTTNGASFIATIVKLGAIKTINIQAL